MRKRIKRRAVIVILALFFFSFTSYSLAEEKGLVGYWKFDEGKGEIAEDCSGKENHGEIHGADWVKGIKGYALKFNGKDDYVNCGNDETLNLSSALTIEAWVKSDVENGWCGIVGKSGYKLYLMMDCLNGFVHFYVGGLGANDYAVRGSYSPKSGAWKHIVATYDDPVAKIYVDGVEVGNRSVFERNVSSTDWFSISSYHAGSSFAHRFNGTIDEVRIYNRALTSEEIMAHYDEFSVVAEKLMLKYVSSKSKQKKEKSSAVLPSGPDLFPWPGYKGYLVARKDYEVSPDWILPKIMEKEFWNCLQFIGSLPVMEKILNEPMVKEAVRRYYIPSLTEKTNTYPAVVSGLFLKRTLKNLDPNIPFYIITCGDCLEDFTVEKDSYLEWKKEHPNFIGFVIDEWDNNYRHYMRGKPLGGLKGSPEAEEKIKKFLRPKDREQALLGLEKFCKALMKYYFDDKDKLIFMNAGCAYNHYPLEWGAGGACLETTKTGHYRHQPALFFTRGAARQYKKPWVWYIAIVHWGYDELKGRLASIVTVPHYLIGGKAGWYKDTPAYRSRYGPDYGMSLSLNKRDKYLAYLSGANIVEHETWPHAYCQDKDDDGVWELSPHGEVMKEWYAFTKRCPERGISYTPVALLLPFSHGQNPWGGKPWSYLPQKRHDYMIDALMYTIVPQTEALKQGQSGCLSNSPYGDICDVLVPNPPSGPVSLKTLSNYKVAILAGKLNMDKPLAERLMEYVREGGTLLLNVKQVNEYFPESFLGVKPTSKIYSVEGKIKSLINKETFSLSDDYEYEQVEIREAKPILVDSKNNVLACVNRYGKGNLILTTVDYLIPKDSLDSIRQKGKKLPFTSFLLKQIAQETFPLEVRGDIEYGLNKLKDGWLLYLINNKGVCKYTRTPQKLDFEKTANVKILLKNIIPTEITELRKDKKISWDSNKNSFSVDVGPGDISVVEIKTKK